MALFGNFSKANISSIILILIAATGVFAGSSAFKPVVNSESDPGLNGFVVYVSDGAILLGKNGSSVSQITDCGAFDVDQHSYAAVGHWGHLNTVGASHATPGFGIHGGKLVYKNNPEFYAIPHGSSYRLSVWGGHDAKRVFIVAHVPGGDAVISDFEANGICHGLAPQNGTAPSKTRSHIAPSKNSTGGAVYPNATVPNNGSAGGAPSNWTAHERSVIKKRAIGVVSFNEADSVIRKDSLGFSAMVALAALLL